MAKQTQKRRTPKVAHNEWYDVYFTTAMMGGTYLDVQKAIGMGRTTTRNWGKLCAPDVHTKLMANYWMRRKRPELTVDVAREELKGTTNKEMSYMFGFTQAGMCSWRKRNRAILDHYKKVLALWQNSPSS